MIMGYVVKIVVKIEQIWKHEKIQKSGENHENFGKSIQESKNREIHDFSVPTPLKINISNVKNQLPSTLCFQQGIVGTEQ